MAERFRNERGFIALILRTATVVYRLRTFVTCVIILLDYPFHMGKKKKKPERTTPNSLYPGT